MKKLLTLAALAVFGLVLTGCPKETPTVPGGSDPTVPAVTKNVTLGALTIKENHPWENGAQNMDVISNYQTMVDVTGTTGVLKAGDKIVVKWEGVSDIDIPAIMIRAIDDSKEANWWKEIDDSQPDGVAIVEDVKAGEAFSGEVTLKLSANAVAKVSLCVYYEASVGSVANITKKVEGDEPPVEEPKEVVIFDAATATAPAGMEIVEIDGVKYLKMTPDGYNTSFSVTPVDVEGKTTVVATILADDDIAGFQAGISVMDASWKSICDGYDKPTMSPFKKTVAEYSATIAPQGTTVVAVIQPMIQDTTSYGAVSDKTIYVGKIWAK